jgi:hypothetical protein
MEKPDDLILDDDSFGEGSTAALAGIVMIIFVVVLALTQSDISLADVALPIGALSLFWLVWMLFYMVVGFGHKFGTKRDINRLFQDGIWQHWQFDSAQWQKHVEAEYQKMRPEEGAGAYAGAIYSGIFGLVFAIIILAVGEFAIQDDNIPAGVFPAIAGAVLLLLVGVGLFQPVQQRYKARKYRRKALRVLEPRVWFGAEGIYHEASGYTSLKALHKIKSTKKHDSITFTIIQMVVMGSSGHLSRYDYPLPVKYSVPSGCEEQAARMVQRYRVERLSD